VCTDETLDSAVMQWLLMQDVVPREQSAVRQHPVDSWWPESPTVSRVEACARRCIDDVCMRVLVSVRASQLWCVPLCGPLKCVACVCHLTTCITASSLAMCVICGAVACRLVARLDDAAIHVGERLHVPAVHDPARALILLTLSCQWRRCCLVCSSGSVRAASCPVLQRCGCHCGSLCRYLSFAINQLSGTIPATLGALATVT
jgi:hypothetical protein